MTRKENMKFTVHQFVLTDYMINEINDSEDRPAFYEQYMNVTWKPTSESILAARKYFKKVCSIEAHSLGEVFEIGNIGPEHKIDRTGVPMHSVSVGDVIVDEDGHAVFVDKIGFGTILQFGL